jgi:precorrin-6B methylase 2
MKVFSIALVWAFTALFITSCAQAQPSTVAPYEYKKGDPNGIGKWYMGREIAYVMGYHGIDWLERPERESEEKTEKLIKNLDIAQDDVIADIGAGSGYHSFRMAPLASNGTIYAVDIQDEMLAVIESKKTTEKIANIETVKGSERSVNLPKNSVDKVLMVDVYHEFSHPKEMLESIVEALKPSGKIFLIEYRKENKWVPIKEVHKMSEAQAVKEFEAAGLQLMKNEGNLPWQHCMVFEKRP